MNSLQKGFRFFHPVQHLWLRATPLIQSGTTHQSYSLEIGLTQRGLDDIGDLTLMKPLVSRAAAIHPGHKLLNLEWEGHSITSADELYHTVWESFSGVTTIESPVSGFVEEVEHSSNMYLDDDTILVKLTTTELELKAAKKSLLVKEPEYLRGLGCTPPGKFADLEGP
jgi:hypothetical protein